MVINPQTGEAVIDGTDAKLIFTLESLMWIEAQCDDLSAMELLERARRLSIKARHLQVILWAGMEAHRRRHGAPGGQINPARALEVIAAGGGMAKVVPQVLESLMRSDAIGLGIAEPMETEAVPTTAGASSNDSSAPVSIPETPGP